MGGASGFADRPSLRCAGQIGPSPRISGIVSPMACRTRPLATSS
jgi:hypothetical protein